MIIQGCKHRSCLSHFRSAPKERDCPPFSDGGGTDSAQLGERSSAPLLREKGTIPGQSCGLISCKARLWLECKRSSADE